MAPAERQRWQAAVACGGRERRQLGRTVGHRGVLGEGQQREARAAGELGGDAWSGARTVAGLGRRGNNSGGGAVARQRRQRRKKKGEGVPGTIVRFQKF
jgi:hypothetical protein